MDVEQVFHLKKDEWQQKKVVVKLIKALYKKKRGYRRRRGTVAGGESLIRINGLLM